MAGMSRISALFTADTSGLASGTKQASASLRGLSADVASMKSSMNSLVGINAAQLFGSIASGVIGAGKAFASLASDSSETIDQLSKMAARLGVSYAEMSGLSLAAELAGVSVGTLAGAMTKADRAFIEAQRGSKSATDAFARIGLSIDDLGKLDSKGRFDAIADALKALPSPAERSAAAIALFGKSGAELLPLFQSGAKGIRESAEWAERLGVALSDSQSAGVEKMNDSWTLVQTSLKGIVGVIVSELAPAITSINEAWVGLFSAEGVSSVANTITGAFWDATEILARGMDAVSFVFTPILELWNSSTNYLRETLGGWFQGIDAWSLATNVFQRVVSLFEGISKAFVSGFNVILSGLGKVGSWLVGALATASEALGFSSNGLREVQKGLDGFAKIRFQSAEEWGDAAGKNIGNAFSTEFQPTELGQRLVSGWKCGFESSIERLRQQKNDIVAAGGGAAKAVGGAAGAAVEVVTGKMVSALDARSKEGNKELLRLIYGNKDNPEEKQLQVQQQMLGTLESIDSGIGGLDGMEAFAL